MIKWCLLESLTQPELVRLVEIMRASLQRVAWAEYKAKRYNSTARRQAMAGLARLQAAQDGAEAARRPVGG